MSVRAVGKVAVAVFKESVRDRVPYSLVIFAVVLMGASFLLSRLTAGQDLKVIKDLGLATMNAIGLLIAIFIGTGLVAKEVERRSIYSLLSKPLSRSSFIVGKYAGLVLTLAVNLTMMTVAFYAMMEYLSHHRRLDQAGLARAGARSAPARPDRAHRRAVDDDDCGGRLLLDFLEPAAGDAVHAWSVGGRSFQRRPP